MTVSHQTRPLAPASVTSALGILRAGGHRISVARRVALEALFAAEGPVSAEELAARHDGDLAALYRNLGVLSRAGIVEHVHVAHGPARYVLSGRGGEGWMACEGCHRLQPLDRPQAARLRDAIRVATGYEPELAHFPIVGRCADCEARP
jgi:Fur family ferric uptake transcriptional regulator